MGKLMSAKEAISRFVSDGDVIYIGYATIPFSLCHEIIRQKKKNLNIVGASQLWAASLLFASGCANRTQTAYSGGLLRRGFITDLWREGKIQIEDYTNQCITLMLLAGALNIPYIPTRSLLGTDFLSQECIHSPKGFLGDRKYKLSKCPFTGEKIVLLPALKPDVSLWVAQRADMEGNIQAWGGIGDARWAMMAAKKVIVSVEEIIPNEVIRSDPHRTILPSYKTSAVVHEPFGAHPGSMTGHYGMDLLFQDYCAGVETDAQKCQEFLDEWVYGVEDRAAYIEHYIAKFGYKRLRNIMATLAAYPIGSINYGYSGR